MTNPYREIQIRTASPLQLVVQMYDRALAEIRRAQQHQRDGDVESRGRSVSKALAILGELREGLDMARGGEIALNLERLYIFATDRLLDGNATGDEVALREAESALEPVHEAWRDLAKRPVEDSARG